MRFHEWIPPATLGDETDASDALALLANLHPAWHRQAACHGLTSLFFHERGEATAEAKEVCRTCPVLAVCREWGINQHPLTTGIIGGLSQRERRAERRRRRLAG